MFREVKVDPRLCFSIRCTSRTLDLQAKSEAQRDQWVKGLSQIHARLLQPSKAQALYSTTAVSATPSAAAISSAASTPLRSADSKHAASGAAGSGGADASASAASPLKSDAASASGAAGAAPLSPSTASASSSSSSSAAGGAAAAAGSPAPPGLSINTSSSSASSSTASSALSAPQTELEKEQEQQLFAMMAKGSTFLKFGRYAKAKSKLLTVSPVNGEIDWSTGSINIKYITDIVVGKKVEKANPHTLFSLVSSDRSFDFQVSWRPLVSLPFFSLSSTSFHARPQRFTHHTPLTLFLSLLLCLCVGWLQATSAEEREMWVKGLRILHARFRSKAPAVVPPSPRAPAGLGMPRSALLCSAGFALPALVCLSVLLVCSSQC